MKTSKVDDDDMGFTPSFSSWKVKDNLELIPRNSATRKSCVSAADTALAFLIMKKIGVGMLLLGGVSACDMDHYFLFRGVLRRLFKGFS